MSLGLSEVSVVLPKDHFLIGGTKPEEIQKNPKYEAEHTFFPPADMDSKICTSFFKRCQQMWVYVFVCI